MKKLFCLMFVGMIVLLNIPAAFAVYDGEILFRDIPWDTDIVTFREQITSEIQSKFSYLTERSFINYFDASNEELNSTYSFNDDENCVFLFRVEIEASDDVRVAGWPIEKIDAYAIHKVENGIILRDASESRMVKCTYHFNTSEIADWNLAPEDIKEKLISLYGDAELTRIKEWDMLGTIHNSFRNVWFGEKTYIELYTDVKTESNELGNLTLSYGITNIMDLLKEIESSKSPIELPDIEGL